MSQFPPPKADRAWREFVASVVDREMWGDWMGPGIEKERSRANDPVVALASFVLGTAHEDCLCEQCSERRALAWSLVSSRHVSDAELDQAVWVGCCGADLEASDRSFGREPV